MLSPAPRTPPPRIQIHDLSPLVEGGRWPVKRTLGDAVRVECDLVRDGHEVLRAVLIHRSPGSAEAVETPMEPLSADRWTGSFRADAPGLHRVEIEAWVDRFASWRHELERKLEGGQTDLDGELAEGAALIEEIAGDLDGDDRETALAAAGRLVGDGPSRDRAAAALAPELSEAMSRSPERPGSALSDAVEVDVDRERARVGAWYELFPRSFGGLAGVEAQLDRLADLGFDVVYLPPIHPIGVTHRKGRNNAPVAEAGDPGSPWAIGAAEGGHTAVHPDLGTVEDLERLVASATAVGIEIALDFAIQCSPDHPWLAEHPEWFHRRPDGTLKYAENPPKKYQDIYNVNFDSPDWRGLWEALRAALLFWVERGVRIFRVDNPHTKPTPFWEWLIRTVRAEHPDVVFLAEAFTTPARMYSLAKAGFSQSYTYFTWKNGRDELTEYLNELQGAPADYFRPNFFANTPDILHAYLQQGGRPAFEARLVLAATLSPSYGIYSGFEHAENIAVAPGSEEYLDSEKYEVRRRALDGPLLPMVRRINHIRRESPPLHDLAVRFLETHNPSLIAYAKGRGPGAILVCVNLDPHSAQEGGVEVPGDLDLPAEMTVRDLLSGAVYRWRHGGNYVRLEPGVAQAHILRVEG
ncbi:MAG: alpha-1,4-glucan--maltose-1-phosphate maltosyltransferase [Thermoleophilia bacterium]